MLVESVQLFQMIQTRMDYLTTRHKLIATNVANADAPDYQTQDLKPFEQAMRGASASAPTLTHASHLDKVAVSREYREDRTADGWELAPSGNNVVLEQEMIKANEIRGAFELSSRVMSKHLQMMTSALNTRS
ncbi:MAG: flagellar biosynthesis protein FlgG [Pseudomonadota bacterium]